MSVFFRRRGEPPATTIAVTITGKGNEIYCYAKINGTKQYSAGTHEVNAGDTITFCVYGNVRDPGYVEIDGTEVLITRNGAKIYNWTVPDGISTVEIAMNYRSVGSQPSFSTITVTTA